MTTIYFDVPWAGTTNEEFLEDIKRQTPGLTGQWNELRAVTDPHAAEFHIAFDSPSEKVDPDRLLVFCAEPPDRFSTAEWQNIEALRKFWIEDYYKPQRWWIEKSYDELANLDPIKKSSDLSWITSDKGLNVNPAFKFVRKLVMRTGYRKFNRKDFPLLDRGPHDGHIVRMDFFEQCKEELFDILHLYGRGSFDTSCYRGEIQNKWDGLHDYRYSLAIENSKGPNYFTEKICDALLAWSMPIYWGCTNIDEFLPENSYVWVDIEDPTAPNRIREVVESNFREDNLGAIAEARSRILDELQIWPTVDKVTNSLKNDFSAEFNNIYI